MSGTVNISRDLWDDTAFADAEFSEREAWVWLIAEASWKPRTRRVGDYIVDLGRGQLAHSTRFMAEKWRWTHSKARRYLERLEKLNLIRREIGTGVSVVTICNYDKYQSPPPTGDTRPAHVRHTSGTNEKKGERRGKEEETPNGVLAPPPPIDEIAQSVAAYNATAQRAGWPSVQKLTPARRAALKARISDAGGATGWEVALAKAEQSAFLCGATGWLPNFDWLTKQANFTKLMEGNYDNRTRRQSPADRPAHRPDPALEQIARLAGLAAPQGNGRN